MGRAARSAVVLFAALAALGTCALGAEEAVDRSAGLAKKLSAKFVPHASATARRGAEILKRRVKAHNPARRAAVAHKVAPEVRRRMHEVKERRTAKNAAASARTFERRVLKEKEYDCEWNSDEEYCDFPMSSIKQALEDAGKQDSLAYTFAELDDKCLGYSSADKCDDDEDCEWDDGECWLGLSDELAEQLMSTTTTCYTGGGGSGDDDGGDVMMELMMVQMECQSHSESDCSGDCVWEKSEDECTLSEAKVTELMFSGSDDGSMMELMTISMECAAFSQDKCSGDCEWDSEIGECSINGMLAFELMAGGGGDDGGDGGDNAMFEMMMIAAECEGLKAKDACDANGQCAWQPSEEDTSTMVCSMDSLLIFSMMSGEEGEGSSLLEIAMLEEECSTKSKADCSGQCEWGTDEAGTEECSISFMVMMELMSGGGEGGGEDAFMMLMTVGLECAAEMTTSSCNNKENCLWGPDEETGVEGCNIDPMVALNLMMGGEEAASDDPMMQLMTIAMECGMKDEKSCSGDCEMSPDDTGEVTCGISMMKTMELMMPDDDSDDSDDDDDEESGEYGECSMLQAIMEEEQFCGGLTSEASCESDFMCEWDSGDCVQSMAGVLAVLVDDDDVVESVLTIAQQCDLAESKDDCGTASGDLGGGGGGGSTKKVEKVETTVDMELSGDDFKDGVTEEAEEKLKKAFMEANGLDDDAEVEVGEIVMEVKAAVALDGMTKDDFTPQVEEATTKAIAKTSGVETEDVTITSVGDSRRRLLAGLDIKYSIAVATNEAMSQIVEASEAAVNGGSLVTELKNEGVPTSGVEVTEPPTPKVTVEIVVVAEEAAVADGDELAAALEAEGMSVEVEDLEAEEETVEVTVTDEDSAASAPASAFAAAFAAVALTRAW